LPLTVNLFAIRIDSNTHLTATSDRAPAGVSTHQCKPIPEGPKDWVLFHPGRVEVQIRVTLENAANSANVKRPSLPGITQS
jgi:hypothetical protein